MHACDKLAAVQGLRVRGLAVNDRFEAPERTTLRAAGVERVVDSSLDPRAAVQATRRAAAVVSHSYHVALFALAGGTPAVLAAANPYYAQKAEGLRRLACLSDAFIVPEPPHAQELADRLDTIRAELRDNLALERATAEVDTFFRQQWERLVCERPPPAGALDTP
jgi:hypothetical protein